MRDLILGTAGHIDHGKTAIVQALTGVDTDRLQEEKDRGITIDLGFAHFAVGNLRFGVVDVPGHEGFVRNMLAGATGMDVVLLVVAADEGVMPQTREHLAIVELLGVRRLVVAVTKMDLVEEEWLELVRDDVRSTLSDGPYAEAPMVSTSARSGDGLEELRRVLAETAETLAEDAADDVTILPVDRVFSIKGTGTVVTGTLWTGTLEVGKRVRLLPDGVEARVRGLQQHGVEVQATGPGARTAVAISGDAVTTETVRRGQVLVTEPDWPVSHMLTARVRVLPDTAWSLEPRQRVHLHLGTAEVLARCVPLDAERLEAGEEGWVQLRLESPVVARVRDRFVLRSYSPVQTFAGGEVAEIDPPKRRAGRPVPGDLGRVLDGSPEDAVRAAVESAGASGVSEAHLPLVTGCAPSALTPGVEALLADGGLRVDGVLVGPSWVAAVTADAVAAVEAVHAAEPFRDGVPVGDLRSRTPFGAPSGLVDAVLASLEAAGTLTRTEGVVARADFAPTWTPAQERALDELRRIYRASGLQPPVVEALPEALRELPGFSYLLRSLERAGELVSIEPELLVWGAELEAAVQRTIQALAGRGELGPADFKEVLPVSRRYLLPILRYFDGTGITRNIGDRREVLPPSG